MRRIATLFGAGTILLGSLFASGASGAEAPSLAALSAGIEDALARREYEASPNARGLQAPNRAHGLRTYFEPTGVRVHDRAADGSPLLALTLVGVGRGSALAPVAAGEVAHEGARVEIRRPGLVEWYENSAAGLEQGFTLAERPEGAGDLVLELALAGASASSRGEDLVFASAAGRKLRYGALYVVDAAGRALPARFELPSPQRVRIAVDDAAAAYPVVVDPLLGVTSDATVEANQDHANLGTHVASAGDVNRDGYADVLAGASYYDDGEFDEGAVFVFHGGPNGIASGGPLAASAKITADQTVANLSQAASAGDVNGDGYADVIVGAQAYDAGEGFREGAAFIYLGGPSGVGDGTPSNADATLESNEGEAWLGHSVAGAGDVNGDGYADVIVGAYRKGGTDTGAAYVFHGGPSGVVSGNPATANAVLTSAQAGSEFGSGVAGAGDVNGDGYADVIVGADLYDSGSSDEGAAFVFHGGASGIANGGPGSANAVLQSDQANAHLGATVAGAGDVNGDGYADVAVGVPEFDNGETDEGAAFVFHGSAGGIASATPALSDGRLEAEQASARLGIAIAGAGDVNGDGYADVVFGADFYDDGNTDGGCFFVLLGSPSGVGGEPPSNAFARGCSDIFEGRLGGAVAGAGDVNGDGYADVIAGAVGIDLGNTNEGAAFVYHGGAQGIVNGNPATAAAQLASDQADAQLGWSVASAGDVNGDGYSDVIIGAPTYDAGETAEGAAFVFLGGASGIAGGSPANAAAQLESDHAGATFGYSVASAGDVNGDGYGDVIVGAHLFEAGETQEGAAFIFLGSASGIDDGDPGSAAAQLESNQTSAQLGWSVAAAGDVNGDGYGDVIAGAPGYDSGEADEGAAFVFLGSATGIADGNPATAAARLESDQADAKIGWSVASAGDVNGDGYADVIVGGRYYDAGETDEGSAFVFHGSASGFVNGSPATAAARIQSDQANSFLGISVASAGDVNGDGYADVIVGAHRYTSGQTLEGVALIFHGGASGIGDGTPANADTKLESDQTVALFGGSVDSAGDVNADGYADVLVGADFYDAGETDEGAAFVFLGGSAGVPHGNPTTASAQLESDQASADFGYSVAPAGDVNGDGHADVIVGALAYDAGQSNEGAAFLFYGNGNRTGRPVVARQLRRDDVTPVQPWGRSGHPTLIDVEILATHPEGRGLVRVELEACEAGVPFGDPFCNQAFGAWSLVGPFGPLERMGGIGPSTPATAFHWRARIAHAPATALEPGITFPVNPAHGPWRRLLALAATVDARTSPDFDGDGLADELDPDDDDDGLTDVDEIGTHGTNPLDADSDDDGLNDGAEIALGTLPNDPDTDSDGVCDGPLQQVSCFSAGPDNCPLVVNPSQVNGDAYAAGDDCQCGDTTGDGTLSPIDYTRAREHVAGRTPSGAFQLDRCDVTGDAACDVEDLAILDRLMSGASASITYGCEAYTGP